MSLTEHICMEAYERALGASFVLLQFLDAIVRHSVAVRPQRTASLLSGLPNHVVPVISCTVLEPIK